MLEKEKEKKECCSVSPVILWFDLQQHKSSQLFLVQKNVLSNILKVSRNLMGGSIEN